MKTSSQRTQDILRRADARRAASAAVRRRAVILAVAAGLLLFVALQLVLFIPYPSGLPDISRFAGSPYYGLMQQLNSLTHTPPVYKNNFEAWMGALFPAAAAPEDDDAAPDASEGNGGYVEVTDNQTDGVIEGDLFKRTQSHIFYLQQKSGGTSLSAFTIAQENSALCGRLDVASEGGLSIEGYGPAELFLSQEGDTALLLLSAYPQEGRQVYTAAVAVDVSDPAHMREVGRVYVSGGLVSARLVGEDLLLVTNFAVRPGPDFADESQYLPHIGAPGAFESLPAEDIFFDETASAARYTVLCRVRFDDLTVEGCAAFLSFSSGVYASQQNIFLTHSYAAESEACGEVNYTFSERRSEIACVSYAGGGLAYRGSADVAGTVLNQYSMDESGGVLQFVRSGRVAITTSCFERVNEYLAAREAQYRMNQGKEAV